MCCNECHKIHNDWYSEMMVPICSIVGLYEYTTYIGQQNLNERECSQGGLLQFLQIVE